MSAITCCVSNLFSSMRRAELLSLLTADAISDMLWSILLCLSASRLTSPQRTPMVWSGPVLLFIRRRLMSLSKSSWTRWDKQHNILWSRSSCPIWGTRSSRMSSAFHFWRKSCTKTWSDPKVSSSQLKELTSQAIINTNTRKRRPRLYKRRTSLTTKLSKHGPPLLVHG